MNNADAFADTHFIAVIGMTGRFPGAANLDEFWRNLRNGMESISFFTDDELTREGVDPAVLADPNYVKAKGILADVESLDAAFFGFNPREAQVTDPQHRLFLECAWEALENAGYCPQTYQRRIGVYAGVGMNTYLFNLFSNRQAITSVSGFQLMIGNDKDYLTTRVSYKLNLKGPSINLQSSCSTSLVAVSLACQSLLNGECDMALAGGVSIKIPQKTGYFYQSDGIVSLDGHCRAFDAKAQGHAGGNGVGIVVLKRLSDALTDGDYIRATIKGFAVNNDGSLKIGFTAPSVAGQAEVISEALAMAGVNPETVTYVETHGTATALGDTVEIEALKQAFRSHSEKKNYCAVGSVKTNIGHTDSAAGVAGLIKTVLALEHRELPPSLFFEEPNPQIDFANSPFYVNNKLRPWKSNGTPLRAGVSSFGIGGTNAHVVLEEAPVREASGASRSWYLLSLSALTPTALETATENLVRYLEQHRDANIADIAYTLHVGRRTFSHRRVIVCRDQNEALDALKRRDPNRVLTGQASEDRPVAFMFPGQGMQYVNMAAELYEGEPVFRDHVDRCSELLLQDLGLDLRTLLYSREADVATDQLEQPWLAQPVLFTIESALVKLLGEWGVRPLSMIGYSTGEYGAAYTAGVFSLEDALKLVATRSRLMQQQPSGAMLAITLPEKEVRALLGEQLTIAAVNGPGRYVVSGPVPAIESLHDRLNERGITCRRLNAAQAYHSKMMEPVLAPFVEQVRKVKLNSPRIPYLSNVTGTWIKDSEATDPGYWARHLRQAVLFSDGLSELLREPEQILLEVGPGLMLQTLTRSHPERSERQPVLSCLRDVIEHQSELECLLSTLGQLWLAGAPVDWVGFYARERRHRLPLPTYPFERKRYWIEASGSVAPSFQQEIDGRMNVMERVETSSPAQESLNGRGERILQKLATIFKDLTGLDASQIDPHARFFELGADSLLLIQATHAIKDKFGVEISLRHLFEELSTLNALALFLDQQLPAEEPVMSPSAREPVAQNSSGAKTAPNDLVERVIAQQLQVMSQQLEVLRNGSGAGAENLNFAPAAHNESKRPEQAQSAPEPFVPFQPIEIGSEGALAPVQQQNLDRFIARFNKATAESKRLTQEYRRRLADPRPAVGFRLSWKEIIYPIIVQRSSGSRVWDVDGNEYLDFTMGFGVHLFGHSPRFITEALEEQLRQGVALGPQSYQAGEVAQMICELTGMERVTFCNSGTEAVMTALRLARTVTGRSRIAMFIGSYHGSSDGVLARGRNVNGTLQAIPLAPGIPPRVLDDVLVLKYDSPESLDLIKAHADDLAAVLVEPVQSRRPDLQPKEFLQELRAVTERIGTALIFDEMITGFRVHPGGCQAWFDVKADIVTYGKVVGGGLPIGVIAGKAMYLDAVDGGMWNFGDSSYPRAKQTFFAGTFCKHPLTMAAAGAVLKHMKAHGPGLQQRLNERTAQLASTLNAYFEQQSLPISIANFSSILRFVWPRELRMMDLFSAYLIEKGIYVWEGGTRFLSTAHSEDDINRFIAAVKESIEEMQEGGLIPSPIETKSNRPLALPLTEGQKQVWTMSQMGVEASSAYNESISLDLRGSLDLAAMRRALQRVVERHDALRATFSPEGDYQLIAPRMVVEIPLRDFSHLDHDRREAEVRKWLTEEIRQPFDLVNGPLLRATIVRLGERHHLLVLTIHHLVTDGWSTGIVLQDLSALYAAECQSIADHLLHAMQYSEYVRRQSRRQQAETVRADEAYWLNQFAGWTQVIELPTDYPRTGEQVYSGDSQSLKLEPVLHHELKRLSAQQGSTLYGTMLAGFHLLLHRLTGQKDIVVGISSAGQQAAGGANLVGYCVNVLPVRSQIREDCTFTEFLADVKRVLLGAYEHQDYNVGQLIGKLNLRREPGRSPLISAYFNMDRPGRSTMNFHDLEASVQTNFNPTARWDLTLNITEKPDELILEVNYKTALFEPSTIRRWMETYQSLLSEVTSHPDISLHALEEVLDEIELQQQGVQARQLKETSVQKFKTIRRRAG